MKNDTYRALDLRSVAVAVVVLLVGAALGFGVGYKYEKHAKAASTRPVASSSTRPTTKTKSSSKQQVQKNAEALRCLASKGVKYPSASADTTRPPAGVTQSAFIAAATACYKALLYKKG